MARDDSENFRVRPGRSRNGGERINPRTQPFLKQVQIAVRKAGGDPRRIGSGARSGGSREGGRTSRFNARGRGAKAVASFARQGGDGGWQRDSADRFRARRVVVKVRVVRLNPQRQGSRGPKMRATMSRAVDAHLRYLEREGTTFLVRENRNLMIGRVRHLERYGVATELEPGRWALSDRAEQVLKELGHRNEVINTIHRTLTESGLAEERGVGQFALHGEGSGQKIVGRVLAKGLAGDEMSERVHLIVDGIDGRVHHIEFKDPSRIEEVGRDMIVEAAPVVSGPRPADRNIAANAADGDGIYRPSRHLESIHDNFERQDKDPEAFIRFHVRRLEALRRAGHVERIDADHWKVPKDIVERGQVYDLSQGGDGLRVRTLSALNLEKQIGSHGATWLDRELIARGRMATADSGFGRQVNNALSRRAQRLVEMGHATAKDGNIHIPSSTVATLQRQEVERVGQQMARECGLTYVPANAGEYVSGRLAGVASLVSGRFAMINNGLGFQLVPWQPLLEKRIGQHVTGLQRDDGRIEWTFGRNRGSACSVIRAKVRLLPSTGPIRRRPVKALNIGRLSASFDPGTHFSWNVSRDSRSG
jgi:hypothetical protein